jgi:tRNA(fMet)-specific endonuclease VapC
LAVIVADSDVLIDALRGREPATGRIRRELTSGELATTSISAFELLSGAGDARARRAIEALLAASTVLPVDDAAGRVAAGIRRDLEADGRPIGMADYLIAGVCLVRAAPLLTRNRAHFQRVPGLALASIE